MDEKYFADDRFVVSDEVKRMTKEERQAEIKRLEAEAAAKKQKV